MRPARTSGIGACLLAASVLAASVLGGGVLGACAGISALARGAGDAMHPVSLAANGLEMSEQARRDALAAGRWDTTRVVATPTADERGEPADTRPDDDLLRALDRGTAAFYAGRWRASVAAFARAAALADDRETKRVSLGALALASNDRVLPYAPGQNERLFVHYYAALAYLRAGATEDAAVEARRMSLLLQRYDAGRDSLDVGARAALRYVAGAIFEAAGAQNDADVAYRNAAALGGPPFAAAGAAPGTPSATGDVVVVVERGFVAHRVGQRLRIWTSRHDDAFASLDTIRQRVELAVHGDDAIWADVRVPDLRLALPADSDTDAPAAPTQPLAPTIVPRVVPAVPTAPPPAVARPTRFPPARPGSLPHPTPIASAPQDAPSRENAPTRALHPVARREFDTPIDDRWRLFTLAWPAYARPAALGSFDGVVVDAAALVAPLLRGDLSLAVAADFKRDRAARLARLVARAILRASLVRSADRSDRSLGDLTAAFGAAIERADTRSWHLLPADLQVVRLHLPPGTHTLALDVDGQQVALGALRVQPRTVQVVSTRLWNAGEHGSDPRMAAQVTTAGLVAPAP